MNSRPIADQTYRKIMQRYEEEEQKRSEVLRITVKQRSSPRVNRRLLYTHFTNP
jgi:hypothetical protein